MALVNRECGSPEGAAEAACDQSLKLSVLICRADNGLPAPDLLICSLSSTLTLQTALWYFLRLGTALSSTTNGEPLCGFSLR